MLDHLDKTTKLLAALKAAVPFEVELTEWLVKQLRAQHHAGADQKHHTVSDLSYAGDQGGIVCHIVPPAGSGRWKDRSRKTVESYRMLDVNQLSEKGCLESGCTSTCQWIDGNEVASISLLAEADRLSLSYTRVRDGEWEEVVQTIPIAHLRCRFGGNRPFFICPGDGTDCGR
jgi:hypothetical protein